MKSLSWLSLAITVIGGVMLSVTFFREIDRRGAPPIVIDDPVADATLIVAVEGAVASPGLVALPSGSRWGDAIEAAGGLVADADSSQLNPAARLVDGERLAIPTLPLVGNAEPEEVNPVSNASPSVPIAQPVETGFVNINSATVSELDALPGIGPVLAQRIVERRGEVGQFRSVDDLESISGISPRMVDEIRSLVTT